MSSNGQPTQPAENGEIKTASQLKKEAKRLEKLEKFKKKQEAQKKPEKEVSWFVLYQFLILDN